MNKTAIKTYAIWARVQLIEAAKQKAYEYEITSGGDNKRNVDSAGSKKDWDSFETSWDFKKHPLI